MTLPARTGPVPQDVQDAIAREIANEVMHHIATMYPDAIDARRLKACAVSVKGVIRNHVIAAGEAAQEGRIEAWIKRRQAHRRELNRIRREFGL